MLLEFLAFCLFWFCRSRLQVCVTLTFWRPFSRLSWFIALTIFCTGFQVWSKFLTLCGIHFRSYWFTARESFTFEWWPPLTFSSNSFYDGIYGCLLFARECKTGWSVSQSFNLFDTQHRRIRTPLVRILCDCNGYLYCSLASNVYNMLNSCTVITFAALLRLSVSLCLCKFSVWLVKCSSLGFNDLSMKERDVVSCISSIFTAMVFLSAIAAYYLSYCILWNVSAWLSRSVKHMSTRLSCSRDLLCFVAFYQTYIVLPIISNFSSFLVLFWKTSSLNSQLQFSFLILQITCKLSKCIIQYNKIFSFIFDF